MHGIRWGRVIAAAVMSELAVIVLLGIVIGAYRFAVPGRSDADYQAFGDLAGYYVAPAAAGVAAFFGALWVTRKLSSGFVLNATLVGVAATVLTIGFIFVTKPENRLMYGVSYLLRVVGAYLAGLVAQRRAVQRSLPA